MNTDVNEYDRELESNISFVLESSTLHSPSITNHGDSQNLRQGRLREKSASFSSIRSSRYSLGTRRSIVAFSSELSEGSIAISDLKSVSFISEQGISTFIGEQGISTFLAACLTANYISVGYLLVPWGKQASGNVKI